MWHIKMKTQITILLLIVLTITARGQAESKKVYYLDTEFIERYIEAYYVGCQKMVSDTSYKLKYGLQSTGEWQVFYDKEYKIKQADYFTRNDTTFAIRYYRSGQKKAEDRTLPDYNWVYSGKWCENGQIISSGNPNNINYRTETTYYCNGNKRWQGNLYQGRSFGLESRWYENGQKQSEKQYTEFDQGLADEGLLESDLISEKFWDENGSEIEPFENEIIGINTLGAPIKIAESELLNKTAYYDIEGQKEYDFTMSAFREEVYKTTQLKTPCKCNVGLVYISFTVEKQGNIEDIQLDIGLENCVNNAFLEAIEKIGKWPPASVNGQKVDTRVRVALELEKIKE